MGDVTKITVVSGATTIPGTPLSVEVSHQVNKIPYARLTYINADGYAGKLNKSLEEVFQPGNPITIKLSYGTDIEKIIFEGLIVQHRIKIDNKSAVSILELRHTALSLTLSRNNSVFINKTDEEIFAEIVKRYSKIEFSSKVASKQHKQMIQAWCSDWDFILSRAESNGWWLICSIDNQLKLIDPSKPEHIGKSEVSVNLNTKSLVSTLDLSIDIENQVDEISAISWDVDKQEVITEKLPVEQEKSFSKIQDGIDYKLYHPGDISQEELNAWAHGRQTKNALSLFKGKIKLLGELNIEPGMSITIGNLGRDFDGEHIVCSVRHVIDANGFQTEIGIGASVDGLITIQDAEAPAAGAMLPAVKGLYIGVVKGYDGIQSDKKNQLLVKVKLPLFGQENNEVWGRLASIYAGDKRGVVFRPEIDDEVVLGFFNDDPRYPVILGSMYSDKNKPPIEFTEDNEEKVIVTKGKVAISLDDKTQSIKLAASEEKTISIVEQGDQAGISLKDGSKNSIILNAKGITCSSEENSEINTKKAVTIKATTVEVK